MKYGKDAAFVSSIGECVKLWTEALRWDSMRYLALQQRVELFQRGCFVMLSELHKGLETLATSRFGIAPDFPGR